MEVRGCAAVVTGAASGLGAATAAALASQGAVVFGLDLPSSLEAATAVEGVTPVGCDVTRSDEVAAALDQVAAGPAPLRVVVNCAGIAPSRRILSSRGAPDIDLFAKVVSVNLIGTFTVTALAAQRIAACEPSPDGERGVVVNTASIAAWEGQVGQTAYAASKGGVVSLTLAAARDLAQYGIRVVTIAPGVMETPMLAAFDQSVRDSLAAAVPFPARLGTAAEFARLVSVAVEHNYLNGETIRMDGALRMAPR